MLRFLGGFLLSSGHGERRNCEEHRCAENRLRDVVQFVEFSADLGVGFKLWQHVCHRRCQAEREYEDEDCAKQAGSVSGESAFALFRIGEKIGYFADDQGDCSAERQFAEVNEERRVCHSDCRFVETRGMPLFGDIDHYEDDGYRAAEND